MTAARMKSLPFPVVVDELQREIKKLATERDNAVLERDQARAELAALKQATCKHCGGVLCPNCADVRERIDAEGTEQEMLPGEIPCDAAAREPVYIPTAYAFTDSGDRRYFDDGGDVFDGRITRLLAASTGDRERDIRTWVRGRDDHDARRDGERDDGGRR